MKPILRPLLAAALLGVAPLSWADPVIYQFDVVVGGNTYPGTFSFDSSSITPGAINSATGLLTDLDIDLTGIGSLGHFDENTANTGDLGFDASGNLTSFFFGNACTAGSCDNGSGEWSASWLVGHTGYFATGNGVGVTSGTVGGVSRVPEPGTLALLALGFAGLGLGRRRKTD